MRHDFDAFSFRPCELVQFWMEFTSCWKASESWSESESGTFVNDLMNMMKSRGPSMEPWGTPEVSWQGQM